MVKTRSKKGPGILGDWLTAEQSHNLIGKGTGKLLGKLLQKPALGERLGSALTKGLSDLQANEERKYQERTNRELKDAYKKRAEEHKKRTGEDSIETYIQKKKEEHIRNLKQQKLDVFTPNQLPTRTLQPYHP